MIEKEQDFSLKKLFVPLTTLKAIHIIIFIGLIVFFNMLFNGFVWDDKTFIILNPEVYSINLIKLIGVNTFNDYIYYRPIPAIYFATLYSLFLNNAFPYHLIQLCFHLINTILLYFLFKHFFKNNISLFLSLIFLVHPMQVESVSYIAQTVSPLYFIFGISAIHLVIRKGKDLNIFFISLLLLLSLLTKETGVLFLILVNIYNYLFKSYKRITLLVASAVTLGLYFVIRFAVGHTFFAKSLLIAPIARSPLSVRLMTVPNVAFYYIKTFFYPVTLGINQDWIVTKGTLTNFFLPLFFDAALIIVLVLLGIFCFKQAKAIKSAYIFFISWFIIGFFFHLQIIPLDMTVADRWFYSTIVGLLGLLGVAISLLGKTKKVYEKTVVILIFGSITFFSGRTIVRNIDWQDSITLYTHDIKIDDNFDIENSIGYEYLLIKQYDKAIMHLKKSIQFLPTWDKNWQNLGSAYHFQEQAGLARKSYEIALKNNPEDMAVTENLGYLLVFYYDANEAKQFLTKAKTKYPLLPKIWYYLSLANYKLGDKNEALYDISASYSLDPSDEEVASAYKAIQNNVQIKFQNKQE